MNFLLGLVLGGVAGVLTERLLGAPLDRLVVEPLRDLWRRRAEGRVARHSRLSGEVLVLGRSALFVRQFAPGGIPHVNLSAGLDVSEADLSRRLALSSAAPLLAVDAATLDASIRDWRARLERDPRRWNGGVLALAGVDVSREPVAEGVVLGLRFRRSDYATFCAVGEAWGTVPTETRRALDGDALREVDPLLSSSFGLNCTVETADGWLVVTRRSRLARGWEGLWHTSFNEGLSEVDLRPGGSVDVVAAFGRGLSEELGVDPSEVVLGERLTIHTLMLDVDLYQWGLLAHLDLRRTGITSTRIRAERNVGGAHDDWEASGLRFIEFATSADRIIDEIAGAEGWVPHGLMNVALSAVHRHPRRARDITGALIRPGDGEAT